MTPREQRLTDALKRIRDHAAKSSGLDAQATLHLIMSCVDAALEQPEPTPDTRPELTERQALICRLIHESYRERGFGPTYRELMAATGIKSTEGIKCHLAALRKKRYVDWTDGEFRTLVLLEAS